MISAVVFACFFAPNRFQTQSLQVPNVPARMRSPEVEALAKARANFRYPPPRKDSSFMPIWSPERLNWTNLTLFPLGVANERYCINIYGDSGSRGAHGVITCMKKSNRGVRKVFKVYLVPTSTKSAKVQVRGTLNLLIRDLGAEVSRTTSGARRLLSLEQEFASYAHDPHSPYSEISVVGKDGIRIESTLTSVDEVRFFPGNSIPITKYEMDFVARRR